MARGRRNRDVPMRSLQLLPHKVQKVQLGVGLRIKCKRGHSDGGSDTAWTNEV